MWLRLFRDRRFLLLALITATVWVLGRHTLSVGAALVAVVKGGYWAMLGTFALWVWALLRLRVKTGWRGPRDRGGWLVALLVVAGGLVWQAHETHGYKVLSDETLLVATSQNLHLDRQVGYAVRATDVQGSFQILQAVLDKRPYFFPFLVSLLHDLTGYRAANAFWLNSILGVVFLSLLFGLTRLAGGARRAGVFGVLVAIGLPLLAQQSAGAGFELLNLCLITAWWWLAARLLAAPGDVEQDAFVLTAVVLACTRYESLLFLVPTALILLVAWRREGALRFTPLTALAPLLVLPMLWLNRAFSANAELWQTASRKAEEVFGLHYVGGNLGHALQYFFSFDGYQPNSPYLGLVGLLAFPVFILWTQRIWRAPLTTRGEDAGLALGALGPFAGAVLLMLYFWGQIDDPVIRRLGLPLQLLLLVGAVIVIGRALPHASRLWNWLIGGAVLSLLAYGLPVMARNAYGHDYSPGVAHAWRAEFLARQPERDFLVVDRDSTFWITEQISATPVAQAQTRRDGIAYHLRNRSFSDVFVYQTFDIAPETGVLTVLPEDALGSDFELEPVAERKTSLLQLGRFSRVVTIRAGEKELATARATLEPSRADFKPSDMDAARRDYLERWVRELP